MQVHRPDQGYPPLFEVSLSLSKGPGSIGLKIFTNQIIRKSRNRKLNENVRLLEKLTRSDSKKKSQ